MLKIDTRFDNVTLASARPAKARKYCPLISPIVDDERCSYGLEIRCWVGGGTIHNTVTEFGQQYAFSGGPWRWVILAYIIFGIPHLVLFVGAVGMR